ncbi:MAG: 2Fe-2S iron-sulfur cluster-binding protein [Bradyrhizobium sp.]
MPRVIFVHANGSENGAESVAGSSVMQAAIANGIEGIVAECGGSAMCATCHVYIGDDWQARLPEMGSVEDEMLESTASQRTNESRLGCQIVMTAELDGLRVMLPERQI